VTKKGETYVCEICGNKVQVLEAGFGTLVCCGQDMTLVE
jgi:desulfoferrodoxin-like iron-binding protein